MYNVIVLCKCRASGNMRTKMPHNFPKSKPLILRVCDRTNVLNERLECFEAQNPYKSLLKVDGSTSNLTKHLFFLNRRSSLRINRCDKNDFNG